MINKHVEFEDNNFQNKKGIILDKFHGLVHLKSDGTYSIFDAYSIKLDNSEEVVHVKCSQITKIFDYDR